MKLLIWKKLSRDLRCYNNFIENMKKIVRIFIALVSLSFSVYSQTVDRDYFKNNILDLDPIEGIYDVQIYGHTANAYFTFPEKLLDSYEYIIYKSSENHFIIKGNDAMYFERIGESNDYNCYRYWSAVGWTKTRFTLIDSNRFELSTDVPDAQIKADQGRNYQVGTRVSYRLNGIKEYPTSSMYRNALEEAIRIEQERERQKKAEESKPTEWSGTGFALNEGCIVTNYHVVENATSIVVIGIKGDSGIEYEATVIATDKINDIAVLRITDCRFTGFGTIPYKVKTATADVGEDVFVLGYPLTLTMGDELKLTTGVISSKTGFQGDVSQYQISAPVQPGNSGGPLFDGKGNLIGIVSSKHLGTENVSYAIKTLYLMNLVESALSSSVIPSNNTISGQTLPGKVKSVRNFVFLIVCSDEPAISSKSASSQSNGSSTNSYPAQENNDEKVIINNPGFLLCSHSKLEIKQVVLTNQHTAISFEIEGLDVSNWINIQKESTFLSSNGHNYRLINAKGIAWAPDKTYFSKGTKEFKLFFEPLPKSTKIVDLIEDISDPEAFKILGILLDYE